MQIKSWRESQMELPKRITHIVPRRISKCSFRCDRVGRWQYSGYEIEYCIFVQSHPVPGKRPLFNPQNHVGKGPNSEWIHEPPNIDVELF
jgi:hypothetical protein